MEDKRDPRIPELRRQPIPYAPPLKLHPAPDCDDQLPVFSRVGRGIKGDSVDVDLVVDEDGHTHLVVDLIDQADGHIIEHHDKIVDGGKLTYGYNLHPFNDPSTFTITFHYEHPSEDPDLDWSWTTPEIPYMWSHEGADEVVGSGIASLFIRKKGEEWYRTGPDHLIPTSHTATEAIPRQEKLIYPEGDTVAENRYYYNAPDPDDPEKKWTVNLTYGISTEDDPTDIDVPSREDLSKIIGISPDNIEDLVNEETTPTDTFPSGVNVKEYIDALDDHIHEDMGFDDILVNDGDNDTQTPKRNTIKKWFDWLIDRLGFGDLINPGNNITVKQYIDDQIDDLDAKYTQALGDILSKIYAGSGTNTMNPDTGAITWGVASANKIPIADLNVFTNTTSPSSSTYDNAIRSRSLSDNDIRFE